MDTFVVSTPSTKEIHTEETIDDDDEFILPVTDPDKPGIHFWQESLTSRKLSSLKSACIGKWNNKKKQVEIVIKRGKLFMTMGYYENSRFYLSPEEALWLLDNGHLYIYKFDKDHDIINPTSTSSSTSVTSSNTSFHTTDTLTTGLTIENETISKPSIGTKRSRHDTKESQKLTSSSVTTTLIWQPPTENTMNDDLIDNQSLSSDDSQNIDSDSSEDQSISNTTQSKKQKTSTTTESTHNSGLITIDPNEYNKYLSFQDAYNFLMQYVTLPVFLVYSHLRMDGFIVLHHQPNYNTGELSINQQHLVPIFDVYARDGINTFRISAPGPPDFYITLLTIDESIPHPLIMQPIINNLINHMQYSYQQTMIKQKSNKSSSSSYLLNDVLTTANIQINNVSNTTPSSFISAANNSTSSSSSRTTTNNTSYYPTLKYAIVCHTTVTFYTLDSVILPPLALSKVNNRRGRGRGRYQHNNHRGNHIK